MKPRLVRNEPIEVKHFFRVDAFQIDAIMERFWEQKIEFNVSVICLEFKKYKMTKDNEIEWH